MSTPLITPEAQQAYSALAARKERPIIFSGDSVRAILEGHKTQTRRVVTHPEYFGCLTGDCPHEDQSECDRDVVERFIPTGPYGVPGDRLWVRETWRDIGDAAAEKRLQAGEPLWVYRADSADPLVTNNVLPWKSPIFMPRWASRITLEIMKVRVERVQDITNEDAIAEGCSGGPHVEGYSDGNPADPYEEYAAIWDSINAKRGYGWDKNPWVWVIEFRRL